MILFLLIALVVIGGCEQNADKNLTGYYFNRNPGDFSVVSVNPDSLSIETSYRMNRGTNSSMLAGEYGPVSAFSIFRFSTLLVNFSNVQEVYITMNVDKTWSDGEFSFELFETVTDWTDSTRIDPDRYLNGLGAPISTFSSIDSTVTKLSFDLDVDLVSTWTSAGAVLLRGVAGGGMARLYSDDTTRAPLLNLVRETIPGELDTTSVTCRDGGFYAETTAGPAETVVSEATGSGFIMNIGVPEVIPELASVNRSILTLTIPERFIPLETMPMAVYRLPEEFTRFEDVAEDLISGVSFTLEPDTERVEIDIAPFVNYWSAIEGSNHGLLFKADSDRVSPNTVAIVAADSLSITYTTLPEVK